MVFRKMERKLFCVCYSVEHFEVYLLVSHMTVYIDYQALVTVNSISLPHKESAPNEARWCLGISRFLPFLKLEYKPGAANVVADALSSAPVMLMETTQPAMQLMVEEHRQDKKIGKTDGLLE